MPKRLLLAAAVLLAAWEAPAAAAVGRWTSVGPDGGWVSGFAVDPANRAVVYAATGGGVFKSKDGGATWTAAYDGLPDGAVLDLAIDPTNPARLYAATYFGGLFVSTDAGVHWEPIAADPTAIVCDPDHGNTVFIAGNDQIWMSADGGRHWRLSHRFTNGLSIHLAADPAHSLILAMVEGPQGFRLHGSADHGATWTILSAALPVPLFPDGWQLAVDPLAPGPLYVSYSVRTPYTWSPSTMVTYQSNDLGRSWHLSGPGGLPVAIGPAHVVYAGRYRSTDLGQSWTQLAAAPDTVQALAVGSSPDTVVAGTSSLGVLRSLDGGRSWHVSSSGLRADPAVALAIDPHDSAKLYVFDPSQFLASGDGGGHWRDGTCIPWACAPDFRSLTLAVDPVDPATVYMASPEGLYKSIDGGAILAQTQPQGIGCLYITSFVLDPISPATLYAAGALASVPCGPGVTPECYAFKSLDGGASWNCLGVGAVSIAIAPSAPSTLYATGYDRGSGTQALFRTTDQGVTWEEVTASLPFYFPDYASSVFLVVDPTDPRRLYAADVSGGLWRSVNGGRVWRRLDQEGSFQLLLAIDPVNPAVIYTASSEVGVVRSADFGRTWQPLLAGLPPPGFLSFFYHQLTADPRHSGTVYLATDSHGVLSYTVPKETDSGGAARPLPRPPGPVDDD